MNLNFNYELPTSNVREKIINEIANEYSFIKCDTLSKSLCLRKIDYIKLGNMSEVILFAGAFHGMEWLTSLLLLHFIKSICYSINYNKPISDIHISRFLKKRGLIVIPCVNPDGVEISLTGPQSAKKYKELVSLISNGNTSNWQANARGVDINHNFNADWYNLHIMEQKSGILGPSKTRYGGAFPESEPETRAITKLCRSINIKHAVAFHSQGEEIYWEYGINTPKKSKLMAQVMAASSGYTMSEPEGLAVGGGFKDWFIQKLKRPAFTIEIGYGKNPLPLSDLKDIYNKLEETLVLNLIM